eukprot:GFYU01037330.1.p2 GENE.GFYU01037330.1~~GFYU01037330.1.p2  ORF type:complete len:163 (+),score=23.45 GFYU01037330.1:73-489(+)
MLEVDEMIVTETETETQIDPETMVLQGMQIERGRGRGPLERDLSSLRAPAHPGIDAVDVTVMIETRISHTLIAALRTDHEGRRSHTTAHTVTTTGVATARATTRATAANGNGGTATLHHQGARTTHHHTVDVTVGPVA